MTEATVSVTLGGCGPFETGCVTYTTPCHVKDAAATGVVVMHMVKATIVGGDRLEPPATTPGTPVARATSLAGVVECGSAAVAALGEVYAWGDADDDAPFAPGTIYVAPLSANAACAVLVGHLPEDTEELAAILEDEFTKVDPQVSGSLVLTVSWRSAAGSSRMLTVANARDAMGAVETLDEAAKELRTAGSGQKKRKCEDDVGGKPPAKRPCA